MKKLIVFLILFMSLFVARADAELFENGATSVRLHFKLVDKTTGVIDTTVTIANLEMYYLKDGVAMSGDVFTGELAGDTTTWVDGECRNMGRGMYRSDWPNAAFNGGIGTQVQCILVDGDGGAFEETIVVELSAPVDSVLVNSATPLSAANIEAEAVDALESFDLDHWMKVTTAVAAGGDLSSFVHNLSVLGHVLSNANVSDYGSDDDSLVVLSDALVTIEGQTDDIGVAGVGLAEAGGTGDQLTAIDLPNQTMTITGDITGNLSGSVGSVTAGVDVVTFNTVATQMEMLMDVTTTVAADEDLEAVVVAGSVLAHVMGSGADVSTYNASTDALDNPSGGATVDEILDEPIADHLTWGTVGWFINLIRAIR